MRGLILVLLILTVVSLWGCQNPVESEAHAAAGTSTEFQEAPINIRVMHPTPSSAKEIISLRGTTLPDQDVTFSAETAGRLNLLKVDLGDRVKTGDILARVDFEMLRAQAEQARLTHDLSVKTFKRVEPLFKDKLVSQQRYDEAQTRQLSSKSSLEMARVQLKKSTVRSTLSGIVARKFVEPGEYVNPGQPLLQVVDFSTIVVSAQVPESAVASVKRDMPVTVRIDALKKSFDGTVHVVIPASHPTARTFEARVKVDNPDYEILVGMATSLDITANTHQDVVLVDQDVILQTSDGPAVYVYEDDKASLRPVTLGSTHEDQVIIKSGVSFTEQIIIEGHRAVVDGQRVAIVKAEDDSQH